MAIRPARKPLSFSLLSASLAAAWLNTPAHTASLGELSLQSTLGQPLEASIRVQAAADEGLAAECFSAIVRDGGADGPMQTARLGFRRAAGGGVLEIHSADTVGEPIVALTVRLRCGDAALVQRDYTLLLDMPSTRPIAAPLAAPSGRPSPAPAAAPRAQPAAAAADPLAAQNGEWLTQGGETYASISRQLLPGQPDAQKALVLELRRLNAHLPPRGKKPLAAGIRLHLPAKLADVPGMPADARAAPARRAAPPKPAEPKPMPPKPAAPPPAQPTPQPQVIAPPPATPTTKLSISAPPETGEPPQSAELDRLNTVLANQSKELEAAREQVARLEQRLNTLLTQVQERNKAIVEEETEAHDRAERRGQWIWLGGLVGLGGLGLAGLAVLLGRWRALRRQQEEKANFLADTSSPLFAQEASSARQRHHDGHETQPYHQPSSYEPARMAPDLAPQADQEQEPSDLNVVYLSDVAAEATLLAAHGQYDYAIELLRGEIAARPTHVVNWIQLLELMHSRRDTDAFLEVAADFRNHFVSETLWEKVSTMGRDLAPDSALFSGQGVSGSNADEITAMLDQLSEPQSYAPAAPAPVPAPPFAAPAPQAAAHYTPPPPPVAEPLVFELPTEQETPPAAARELPEFDFDLPEELPPPQVEPIPAFDLIDIEPPLELTAPDEPDEAEADAVPGEHAELRAARRLIQSGQQEAGAAILERLMMSGSHEERAAAGEMLVKLTMPR